MREYGSGPDSLLVEIVAYAPTAYSQCTHCEIVGHAAGVSNSLHNEQLGSSLPPDLALDFRRVSDWASAMVKAYRDRLTIRVIDAASMEGFYKRLRHRIRRYPAVIVGGKKEPEDDRFSDAEESIARILSATRGGVHPCSQA